MLISRVLSRIPKSTLAQLRTSLAISPPSNQNRRFSVIPTHFRTIHEPPNKGSLLNHSILASAFDQRGLSSSASPVGNKEESKSGSTNAGGDTKSPDQTEESGPTSELQNNRRRTKANPLSEYDSEDDLSTDDLSTDDLSTDDLLKLVAEKEELLEVKQKEIEKMQDKVLRTYAEMENVMDRTRREAENSKKFAIQNFAKNLLDVADNLGRASSVVKVSFEKIDQSKDSAGAVPLLKTLLEGVDMTDKQLAEVFKKFGVEKYDPLDEQFDPHRHNAVFQMPDASKPPGTVAAVLKSGYMLYDRVIRPAEVGVTQAVESNVADQGSEA